MATYRPSVAALAWVVAAVVISLGAAGLVTALDAPPAGGGRPELTDRGDALVRPALGAAEADLELLARDVAALGVEARGALASLNGSDLAAVEAAVARGDALIETIRTRTGAIDDALGAVPLLDSSDGAYRVSAAQRERRTRLRDALGATVDLQGAWARLTTGSIAASRLAARLDDHDQAVLKAAEQGRNAKYKAAAATLDDADAAIADARTLRDRLAATVDVSTLDQWLDRNADYDTALRALYLALKDVGGRVTDTVRDAVAAERAAKDRLPPDRRGMIVIMAEIGRGGMSIAVIAIEEARGRLTDALAVPSPSPLPDGASPEPTAPA
jgi:hypothetical protein